MLMGRRAAAQEAYIIVLVQEEVFGIFVDPFSLPTKAIISACRVLLCRLQAGHFRLLQQTQSVARAAK